MKKFLFLLLPLFSFGQNLSLHLPFSTNDTYIATTRVYVTYNGSDIIPAIQAAHDAASDYSNTTIVLSAGTFIALSTATFTKHLVSLEGQGIDQTILYRPSTASDGALNSWKRIIYFNINDRGSNKVHVSGITFKSKDPVTSSAADDAIEINKCIDFSIYNCRFENFGNGAIEVHHYDDLARGLITNCQFYHNAKQSDGLGLGYGVVIYGEDLVWVASSQFGTDNFIFVENNTFDYHRHAIAAGGTALYVFRYNTIDHNIIGANSSSAQAIDGHGARGGTKGTGNYFATRAVEIYKNYVVNTTYVDGTPITAFTSTTSATNLEENAILIRGGESVIHDNYISGFRFGVGATTEDVTVTAFGSVCPIGYTIGYLSNVNAGCSNQGITTNGNGDLFEWRNAFKVYTDGSHSSTKFFNYNSNYLSQGRDFHTDTVKPSYAEFTFPHPLRSAKKQAAYEYNKNPTYCAHAQSLFAKMSIQPTDAQKVVYNYAIRTYLDETGIFTELDFLHVQYVGAGLGTQAANLNWINPSTYSLTPVNFASSFVEKSGYPGVFANSTYFRTSYTPSVNGVTYTLNDGSFGVYTKLNIQDGSNIVMGVSQAGKTMSLAERSGSNQASAYVNETTGNFHGGSTDASGVFAAIRTASNVVDLKHNGTSLGTGTGASTALPTAEVTVGARNLTSASKELYSNNIIQMDFIGASDVGNNHSRDLQNMMLYLIGNMP